MEQIGTMCNRSINANKSKQHLHIQKTWCVFHVLYSVCTVKTGSINFTYTSRKEVLSQGTSLCGVRQYFTLHRGAFCSVLHCNYKARQGKAGLLFMMSSICSSWSSLKEQDVPRSRSSIISFNIFSFTTYKLPCYRGDNSESKFWSKNGEYRKTDIGSHYTP